MRISLLLIVAGIVSVPTLADGHSLSPSYGGLGSTTNIGNRECLTNKRTHELVCKTRAEWRIEAARLDRLKHRKLQTS